MRQFTLELDKDSQRPVVTLKEWSDVAALIDTGAVLAVWTDDEQLLKELGGFQLGYKVPIAGFGGAVFGNVYELEKLQFGSLVYPKFKLVVCTMPKAHFQLILPATMFSRLLYEIDDKNHMLNVTIPDDESNVRNLTIKGSGGRFYVLCDSEAN